MRAKLGTALVAAFVATVPAAAHAFCGFYVSGADAKLFNNATQVVLMREGKRTVMAMQNNYQGPPEDFAMVVPVPVVLQEENVKTLSDALFDRVDALAAPRLVEYWEQDPCAPQPEYDKMASGVAFAPGAVAEGGAPRDLGVTIEAKFEVGEYQIVILSAKDSTGLDTWLRLQPFFYRVDLRRVGHVNHNIRTQRAVMFYIRIGNRTDDAEARTEFVGQHRFDV